jgi:hypothetical protein
MDRDTHPHASHTSDEAVVHVEYNERHPPSYPQGGPSSWTRFVAISDNHSHTFPVPHGDVLLHSGDLTKGGSLSELTTTVNWLRRLPHPIKMWQTV